jgi:hypothetical protein
VRNSRGSCSDDSISFDSFQLGASTKFDICAQNKDRLSHRHHLESKHSTSRQFQDNSATTHLSPYNGAKSPSAPELRLHSNTASQSNNQHVPYKQLPNFTHNSQPSSSNVRSGPAFSSRSGSAFSSRSGLESNIRGGFNHGDFDRGDLLDHGGFDRSGFDRGGFNRSGFDHGGFNRSGFDRSGFDRSGFDHGGFDHGGGFDRSGFDRSGFDRGGFDHGGFDHGGFDRDAPYTSQDQHHHMQKGKPRATSASRGRVAANKNAHFPPRDNTFGRYLSQLKGPKK